MKSCFSFFLVIGLVFTFNACTTKTARNPLPTESPYLGQKPPGLIPEVFAPGIVSIDDQASASITFNSDMTEFFLNHRKKGKNYNIYTMKLRDGKWSELELAPFSTHLENLDFHPRFTLKGDRLYFGSTRPVNERRRLRKWYVEKNENGDWGEPMLMGEPFADIYIMGAVPSENGNLYFTSGTRADGEGIYYAVNQDGQYASIARMDDAINSNGKSIAHPYIAPDESYLIYDSNKANEPENGNLFISFNQNGTWTKSYPLAPKINTELSEGAATVSPDGKYLFFTRSEKKVREDESTYWESKIYWVDFTSLKEKILDNVNSN